MHILFNMWMLYVLGSGLESRVGSLRYLVFVIACGAISNFLQGTMPLAIDGSYRFGGMSGVVYGLFGWVLMRQMFGRSQGMMLSQFSIIFIVGWLFAGIFHMVPNIANWCHGVGFAVGLFTGYFPELFRRR